VDFRLKAEKTVLFFTFAGLIRLRAQGGGLKKRRDAGVVERGSLELSVSDLTTEGSKTVVPFLLYYFSRRDAGVVERGSLENCCTSRGTGGSNPSLSAIKIPGCVSTWDSDNHMETALEHILTSSYKAGMISYMDAHPEDFEEAIKLAVSNKQPYSWRAAWLLWSYMEENDPRIQGDIKNIIKALTSRNDNHQRELLKILLQMELNDEYEGLLFNVCVSVWEKINKRPSVRLTALKIIVKIAKKHPDLFHEIIFLTQNQYLDSLSPAVKKAISRMIREFTPV
jgi:hypothetical protein